MVDIKILKSVSVSNSTHQSREQEADIFEILRAI